MKKVRVGIVGLGAIAKNMHVPALASIEDVELVAATEVDIKRGEEFAKKWNIGRVFDDYNKMYEESNLDAVFICLPNFLHYKAVRSALEKNVHVFCEKPMGVSAEEANELVKIAKSKNLILAIGYNRRLMKKYEEASEIVRSLKLGNILQAQGMMVMAGPYAGWIPSSDWFFKDKYGVLYDIGPHMIDLLLYVLSDRIDEVTANGISTMKGMEVYDNIAGSFKTQKGIIGSFNIGWRHAAVYDSIQVHGTGSSILVDPREIQFRYSSYDLLDRVADNVRPIKNIVKAQLRNSKAIKNETFYREDKAFIDAIMNKGHVVASGEDALLVLEVLEGIRDSINTGSTIKIKHYS